MSARVNIKLLKRLCLILQYSFAELNKFSVQELYNILAIFNQEEVPEGCQPGYNQDSHHRKNHNQPK